MSSLPNFHLRFWLFAKTNEITEWASSLSRWHALKQAGGRFDKQSLVTICCEKWYGFEAAVGMICAGSGSSQRRLVCTRVLVKVNCRMSMGFGSFFWLALNRKWEPTLAPFLSISTLTTFNGRTVRFCRPTVPSKPVTKAVSAWMTSCWARGAAGQVFAFFQLWVSPKTSTVWLV